MTPSPWRISLHGGHSTFCDHADDPLEDIIQAAIAAGCPTYGIAEHAPRVEPHRLFQQELELGWDVATLERIFTEYAETLHRLADTYADRITILKGFEIEVVPEDSYVDLMLGYRERLGFEYMVGSVHWVGGHIIDYTPECFQASVDACGGLEACAIRYYQTLAQMIIDLKPEVVAHFDLMKKLAPSEESVTTPKARTAALDALDQVRQHRLILDINTSALRRGFATPYPAPWILEAAHDMGIDCCFGDDSHRVSEVAYGFDESRQYLLSHGINHITTLRRETTGLGKENIPLE